MLRFLLYFVLVFLVFKLFKDLFTHKQPRDKSVYGDKKPKKKIEFDENDIEDAKFKDIDE